MTACKTFRIGIPVYDGVDLLDVSVPFELFNWMATIEPGLAPDAPKRKVELVSLDGASVTTRDGMMLGHELPQLHDCEPFDLIWVPGGDPTRLQQLMLSRDFRELLARHGALARHVCSVCEGALLLASAGLLDGYRATTHWAFIACLKMFPAIKVADCYPRFVIDRNRVTGGGISSGLDEALAVIAMVSSDTVAKKVQLTVQYHPDPPFNYGDPGVARPPIYTPGEDAHCAISGMADTIRQLLANGTGQVAGQKA